MILDEPQFCEWKRQGFIGVNLKTAALCNRGFTRRSLTVLNFPELILTSELAERMRVQLLFRGAQGLDGFR